jgi:hypothetical protein
MKGERNRFQEKVKGFFSLEFFFGGFLSVRVGTFLFNADAVSGLSLAAPPGRILFSYNFLLSLNRVSILSLRIILEGDPSVEA